MNTMTHSDCIAYLRTLPDASVDSCVTDPPYELGFMGKKWDSSGIAYSVELWREVLRALKPGAHLLAFGGTRTHHRMVCAIEDAGFEIRDEMQWLYGSGFPKSLDVSKAIDKAAGELQTQSVGFNVAGKSSGLGTIQRQELRSDNPNYSPYAPATPAAAQWAGWGTALKPACEPICVARKPLCGTVAANVLAHGTGGINVDGCRIGMNEPDRAAYEEKRRSFAGTKTNNGRAVTFNSGPVLSPEQLIANSAKGRWPANVILSHAEGCVCTGTKRVKGQADRGLEQTQARSWKNSSTAGINRTGYADADGLETVEAWQCVEGCPVRLLDAQSGERPTGGPGITNADNIKREWGGLNGTFQSIGYGDTGGASSFFYTAKASKSDREHFNTHATVKPLALMRYLVRLVTPPGGVVLDMFAGSGTTLVAARQEGFRFLGCDADEGHVRIAQDRLALELPFET